MPHLQTTPDVVESKHPPSLKIKIRSQRPHDMHAILRSPCLDFCIQLQYCISKTLIDAFDSILMLPSFLRNNSCSYWYYDYGNFPLVSLPVGFLSYCSFTTPSIEPRL